MGDTNTKVKDNTTEKVESKKNYDDTVERVVTTSTPSRLEIKQGEKKQPEDALVQEIQLPPKPIDFICFQCFGVDCKCPGRKCFQCKEAPCQCQLSYPRCRICITAVNWTGCVFSCPRPPHVLSCRCLRCYARGLVYCQCPTNLRVCNYRINPWRPCDHVIQCFRCFQPFCHGDKSCTNKCYWHANPGPFHLYADWKESKCDWNCPLFRSEVAQPNLIKYIKYAYNYGGSLRKDDVWALVRKLDVHRRGKQFFAEMRQNRHLRKQVQAYFLKTFKRHVMWDPPAWHTAEWHLTRIPEIMFRWGTIVAMSLLPRDATGKLSVPSCVALQ